MGAQAPATVGAQRPQVGPLQGDALRKAYQAHMQQAMAQAQAAFIQQIRSSAGNGNKLPRRTNSTLRSVMPTGLRGKQIQGQLRKLGE